MSTYFMFGKYSSESVKDITKHRTQEVVGILESADGQIIAMYGLLGQYDLVIIVNLPGNNEAMRASIEMSRQTGISFTTAPAIPVEKFDSMLAPRTSDQDVSAR